jgi:kynureninase
VTALLVLEDAIGLMQDVGIARLRDTGRRMIAHMMDLIAQQCGGHGLEVATPDRGPLPRDKTTLTSAALVS